MNRDRKDDLDSTAVDHSLETADAVARAAHIWVRSLCLSELQEENERHALASGLVTGLCERLVLDPRVRELVTYIYSLLDDEGSLALSVSRKMLDRPVRPPDRQAYKKGRSEAAGIVEMLAYRDK